MLRQNHRFTKLNHCIRHWQGYRLHMCGLCHALGDSYGQLSRLLTSRELILLNMLVSAQLPEIETIERRCPLNPMMHVQTNVSIASEFSAALAVKLSAASVADDRQDEGGLVPYLAQLALKRPVRQANHVLETFKFSSTNLDQLTTEQAVVESQSGLWAEIPSAQVTADIFAMTATLAHTPANADILSTIGQAYGATIYWLDAYADFADDMKTGAFNPLRGYAQSSNALSLAGLQFLSEKFQGYASHIQQDLAKLDLQRYRADLETLLLEPLDRVCAELKHLIQEEQDLHFKPRRNRWSFISMLAVILALFGMSFTQYEPELPDYETRRKKRRQSNSDHWFWDNCCYCCTGDGTYDGCCGCCCDMNPVGCCDCCGDKPCCEVCGIDCCDCSCGDCDCAGCDCDCS